MKLFWFCKLHSKYFCYWGDSDQAEATGDRHDLCRNDQVYKCQENIVLNKEVPPRQWLLYWVSIVICEWFGTLQVRLLVDSGAVCEKMRLFKRRGSEIVDPQLTGLRFDQVLSYHLNVQQDTLWSVNSLGVIINATKSHALISNEQT